MIKQLYIKNFKSINETLVLDFTTKGIKNLNENLSSKVFKDEISRINLFYGKNGAGKSNIFEAIKALKYIAINKNPDMAYKFLGKSATEMIVPFKLVEQIDPIVMLGITFFTNNMKYRYSFRYNSSENLILDETLEKQKIEGFVKVFSKELTKVSGKFTKVESERIDTYKLDEQSLLSVLNDSININDIETSKDIKHTYGFFEKIRFSFDDILNKRSLKFLNENKNIFKIISDKLKMFDVSMDSLDVKHMDLTEVEVMEKMFGKYYSKVNVEKLKDEFEELLKSNSKQYELSIIRDDFSLNFNEESEGTKFIGNLLYSLYANPNSIWVLDDFENYFHHEVIFEVVDFFINNFLDSQFLIATHELGLLNKIKFKPSHYFVERNNETYNTSITYLTQFSDLRNDERHNWLKFYDNFRLGQYPKITINEHKGIDHE